MDDFANYLYDYRSERKKRKLMDLKHFPDFYRVNVQRIHRFIYFRVRGDTDVAEDLTQDVFLKAFAAFESYDPNISSSSWIFTIARNHVINYMQKQHPGTSLDEIENTIWDRIPWDKKMESRHDQKRLMEALRQLPEQDREIVRLKHIEGWTFNEIAEKMGKNAGALRVQSHRALRALRKIMKQK